MEILQNLQSISWDKSVIQQMIRSANEELLSIQTFLKISILFLLINMSVIGRLHMFDSNPERGEDYFNSEILAEAKTHRIASMTVLQQLEVFFTQIDFETIYLLPFIFELSALSLLFFRGILDKLFLSLIVSICANLLCFLSLAIKSDNFLIYRLTYIIQALFIFPQIIFSSFGLTKIMPKQIRYFKGLYATLMFIVPNFAIPISYWVFHDRNDPSAIHRGVLKCSIFATILSVFAFFLLFQNRIKITFILDQDLVSALDRFTSIQTEQQIFDREIIKKKLKAAGPKAKQSFKVFQQNISNNNNKKKEQKRIPHSNLSSIIMLLGLIIAVGNQLEVLQKQIYLSIRIPEKQVQIQQAQNHSSLHEFYQIFISTFLALTAFILIQNKNISPLSISLCLIITGFCSMMIIFCVLNNVVPLSISLIKISTIVAKAFFSSIVIPSIIFIENAGIDTLDCLKILLLINWALELLLRIFLSMADVDLQVFLLSFLVIISCYYIEKMSKEVIRQMQEEQSNYAKIDQEFDQQGDNWIQQQQRQYDKNNIKVSTQVKQDTLNSVEATTREEKENQTNQIKSKHNKRYNEKNKKQIETNLTLNAQQTQGQVYQPKEEISPSVTNLKRIRIDNNILSNLKKDGNKILKEQVTQKAQ